MDFHFFHLPGLGGQEGEAFLDGGVVVGKVDPAVAAADGVVPAVAPPLLDVFVSGSVEAGEEGFGDEGGVADEAGFCRSFADMFINVGTIEVLPDDNPFEVARVELPTCVAVAGNFGQFRHGRVKRAFGDFMVDPNPFLFCDGFLAEEGRDAAIGGTQNFLALWLSLIVRAGVELPDLGFVEDVAEVAVPRDETARVGGGEEVAPTGGGDVLGIIFHAAFGSFPVWMSHVAAVGVVGSGAAVVGFAGDGGVEHDVVADADVMVGNQTGNKYVAEAVGHDGCIVTE